MKKYIRPVTGIDPLAWDAGCVNFGEVECSHQEAVDFMRNHAEVTLPRRFKTVVTTSAGDPLDRVGPKMG